MRRALTALGLAAALAACGDDGDGRAAAEAAPAGEPPAGLTEAQWGEQLFRSQGCTACHTITGSRSVGTPLDGLLGTERSLEDGSEVIADPVYLKRSIVEPQAQVVEGYGPQMPSYEDRLSDAEVQALVAYLRTLR